ncbi:hypothetical protein DOY81_015605, partial [Sarcophaga bullata]
MATNTIPRVIKRQTSFVSESTEAITKTIDDKEGLQVTSNDPHNTSALRAGFQLNTKSGSGSSWETCYYCTRENFKTIAEFVKHLRERHCTREGGSFVCRYGFNGVCPSLPLDGVSDRDYDAHVAKYHVNQQTREMPPEWSVFSA